MIEPIFKPEWKRRYKKMKIESIVKELRSRNKYVANYSLIECAIWLKNKSI